MPNFQTNSYSYPGELVLGGGELYGDEVAVFTGAGTILRGTILGRVTASGKIKPWASGSSDGSEKIVGIATVDVEAAGAGDVSFRMLLKGDVNRKRLIIAADGNGNNLTAAHIDQLRNVGITAIDVDQIGAPAP